MPPPMGGRGGRNANFSKPTNMKTSLKKLITFIKPYFPLIIIALIFSGGAAVITIIGPTKISDLTAIILKSLSPVLDDKVTPNPFFDNMDLVAVAKIGFTLIAMYSTSFVINYFQGFVMNDVTQKVAFRLRQNISRKINKVPFSYYNKNSTGDVLSRIVNDVDTIASTLNNSISSMFNSVCLLVGCIAMMFVKNWILALTAIGTSIIGFLLMGMVMKFSQKFFMKQQQSLGALNGKIEETYSSHSVVVAYNAQEKETDEFKKINNELFNASKKAQFFGGLFPPIMSFVSNLGFVAVCIVGSILVSKNLMELHILVAFMIYVRIFNQPLSQIAQGMQNLQMTGAASERVFEFLETDELGDESGKTQKLLPEEIKGDVEFENVVFGYDSNKVIIHDLNVKVKAGQKIAIVGETGAGKTTIINLLMRFEEIQKGSIKIDGVSIQDITRENVHNLFSMVLQDAWMFDGTVKENIRFNDDAITDEEIVNACKLANLHHFIETLPHGYDTVLNENTQISNGQKQLLTIARAMVQNNPMLILDEATSSVDTRTEILIQEAMDKLMHNKTSFVIAHRLSTIKNANLILVLDKGNVVEQGSHDELIELNGTYAKLYASQFED